ncbi:MAG: SNF2-related protein [Nostocaceae cyanobacterium]|nr:SNF2-related protein [Nostocaceae cyanobacterium]
MFLIRGIAKLITRAASGVRYPDIYLISDWRIEPAVVYRQSFQFPVVLTSDNLCLVMARSRPSGNLLPNVPEIYEVQESLPIPENLSIPGIDIPQPAVFDCTDWFIEGVICSDNYLEPLTSTKTFKYEKVTAVVPQISEDLFCLLTVPEIFGQLFGQVTKQQSDLEDENKSVIRRKQSKDKIPTRSPSQWDLLQPILLPPLSLEFPKELDFYRQLRGYQQQGISWLVEHPSALLADEMGTGKTVQAVNALRLLFRQGKICSALIVCPPAVIGSIDLTIETGSSEGWSGHFYHWASELEIAVIHGGSQQQRKLAWERPFHVYITTYDTLRTDIRNQVLTDCNKFDCIILDEAQKIKNRDSKTSQAIRYLQSGYRWALTGTPIENRLDDVKSLFDFILPGLFKGGVEDSPQAVTAAIDPYMLRRLKQDVLQDIPDKVRQEDWLTLDKHQKADYDRALQAGRRKIETSLGVEQTIQVRQHIFALLNELKQICNFAKGQSESPKTELLLEYVETIADNKKKVLIFSQYREEGTDKIAKLLDRKGIQYVVYTGEVSKQQKNQAVSDFRNNPAITVFLATIDTAGYGITLTEATYVIHFDHPWNPAKMQNAEDRTHRIGQKSGVTVYSFWMKGTVEERIKKKLIEKRLLVESTVDELAVEAIENGLSTEDWLDIFGIKPKVKTIEIKAKPADAPQPEVDADKTVRSKTNSVKRSESTSNQTIKSTTEYNQMSNDRLRAVEENLELIRKDIAGREKAKILAAFEEKTRIELGIQELRKQMRPFEEEYWQIIVARSTQVEIAEPKPEIVVAELVEQVEKLQNNNQYPDEVLQILQKIYIEVSKPGTPAAAKLKAAVSMFPPFVSLSFEAEIDTENFCRTHLPTFTKWYKALAKR